MTSPVSQLLPLTLLKCGAQEKIQNPLADPPLADEVEAIITASPFFSLLFTGNYHVLVIRLCTAFVSSLYDAQVHDLHKSLSSKI